MKSTRISNELVWIFVKEQNNKQIYIKIKFIKNKIKIISLHQAKYNPRFC